MSENFDDFSGFNQEIIPDWCPTCEPEKDPLTRALHLCYCSHHQPSTEGTVSLPDSFTPEWYIGGDTGGAINRHACAVVHQHVEDSPA